MAKCFRKRMETFRNHRTATMTFTWNNVFDLHDKYLDERAFCFVRGNFTEHRPEVLSNLQQKLIFSRDCWNWILLANFHFYWIFIFKDFSSDIFSRRNAIAVNPHSNRLKFLSIFPDELFFPLCDFISKFFLNLKIFVSSRSLHFFIYCTSIVIAVVEAVEAFVF